VSAVIVSGPLPSFVIVTCCPELVVFRACGGNTSDAGARTTVEFVPVPASCAVCEGMVPPKLRVRVPV